MPQENYTEKQILTLSTPRILKGGKSGKPGSGQSRIPKGGKPGKTGSGQKRIRRSGNTDREE